MLILKIYKECQYNNRLVLCFQKSGQLTFWGLIWFICSSLTSFGWSLGSLHSPDRLQSILAEFVWVELGRWPACLLTHKPFETSSGRSALSYSRNLWPFHERNSRLSKASGLPIKSILLSSLISINLFISFPLLPFPPSFLLCQPSTCSILCAFL